MWKRRRTTRDFSNEIESHLAIEADRLMAEGMSEDEARHVARRSFGNVTSRVEEFHASRPAAWFDSVWRNVRYALRGLARRPVFAVAAVLTLAFGIGVNAALFTLFYSLVLRPPAVGEPSRHVNVFRDVRSDGREYRLEAKGRSSMLSWPDFVRLREGSRTLEQLAVYRRQTLRLDMRDLSTPIDAQLVSCNYFVTVRLPMHLGRAFAADECESAGAGRVVVLTHAYWTTRFGSDSSVLGRSMVLNAQPLTVVGIASPGFHGLAVQSADAWLPISMLSVLQPASASDFERDVSWLTAFGRLNSGASIEQAAAELTLLARREDANWAGRLSTIRTAGGSAFLDPDSRRNVLLASTGAMVFGALILLMCSANVMNLLLARGAVRRREIGIRLAVGASRSQLLVQLLIESSVLAVLGGALGLVLAWVLPPIIRFSAPDERLNLVLTPDAWVLVATLVLALGATFMFGLFPALQSTRLSLSDAIRSDASTRQSGGGAARWRGAAVVAQVSVSALLLVVAAMFLRATQRSLDVATGYELGNVSVIRSDFGPAADDSAHMRQFNASMRTGLAEAPGVQSVALALMVPLRGRASTMVDVRGDGDAGNALPTLINEVSGNYFATLGIAFVAGRTFTDDELSDPLPAIVSESFAQQAWPASDAVGRTIRQESRRLSRRFMVVGVVRDVQSVSPGIPDGPYVYTPVARATIPGDHQLVVRSGLRPTDLQSAATRIARTHDPHVLITARGLDQELERVVAPVKVAGQVASGLGLTALLLAMIGVYGVVSFTIAQRSREIGIRMALGATEGSVRNMVFQQGARVVGAGLAIGIIAGVGFSRAIRSVLFGLDAVDGVALGSVFVVLSAVAAVAVAIPAIRASRVDPIASLRAE